MTIAVLGYGFYSAYLPQRQACADRACERPLPTRTVKLGLWLGAILVAVAVILPRVASALAAV